MVKQQLLSKLPSIDEVLKDQHVIAYLHETARDVIVDSAREVISEARERIMMSDEPPQEPKKMIEEIIERIQLRKRNSLKRAINATGVVLHTNLGRAGLSPAACSNVVRTAAGYSTLEYDVRNGRRGLRNDHVEELLRKITGADAALVVNNNAAATMLCLCAMAEGREVIVSRGELVEIGGSFRIPDIMKRSGAALVEVGTTNKTRLDDYRSAMNENTAAIMKVHTSNYRIVGFTAEACLEELVFLGKENDLPVIYDMGSGLMLDLREHSIGEPTVVEALKTGIDVILFSGDKLLGGPQAGIIAGRKELIGRMKRHSLARVLRVDKMTLAALEETLRIYLEPKKALKEIPVLAMLTASAGDLKRKAISLAKALASKCDCMTEVVPHQEKVGGGSAPTTLLEGWAVAIQCGDLTAEKVEHLLRSREVPIIVRIIKGRVHFDVRTISEAEADEIVAAMAEIREGKPG